LIADGRPGCAGIGGAPDTALRRRRSERVSPLASLGSTAMVVTRPVVGEKKPPLVGAGPIGVHDRAAGAAEVNCLRCRGKAVDTAD